MTEIGKIIQLIQACCPTDGVTLEAIFKEDDIGEALNKLQLFMRIHSDLQLNIQVVECSIRDESLCRNPEHLRHICFFFEKVFSQSAFCSYPLELQESFLCWLSSKILIQDLPSNEEVLRQLLTLLNFILENKTSHSRKVYVTLGGPAGALIKVLGDPKSSLECCCQAAKGLHLLSYIPQERLHLARSANEIMYPSEVVASMQRIALLQLNQLLIHPQFTEEISILAVSCLSVLYNLLICVPDDVLGGTVLNASFPFAFHGLPESRGVNFVECSSQSPLETPQASDGDSDSICRTYTNRNRRKRLRRKRAQPSRSTIEPKSLESSPSLLSKPNLFVPRSFNLGSIGASQVSLKPQWMTGHSVPLSDANKAELNSTLTTPSLENHLLKAPTRDVTVSPQLSSSDSLVSHSAQEGQMDLLPNSSTEPSHHMKSSPSDLDPLPQVDFEKGPVKFSLLEAKVRRSALILINAIINKAGRQNKFSFWPQTMCQTPSLMTSVLRDPSICVRMASLQVINTFLIDSQSVLKMAVDEKDIGSYSTLGRQLGTSIRELHRCLALCLLSERVPTVLVRILKTIELLIENVNYANFKPGLLTKIITHVKYFLKYKEAVVQANAFSVMVSLLMKRPSLTELKALLMKYQTPVLPLFLQPPRVRPPSPCDEEMPDANEEIAQDALGSRLDVTLTLSSEEETSSDSSCDPEHPNTMVSWITHRCVDSLLLHGGGVGQGMYVQVQLQSLKVLSALVSEHLFLMKSSIPLIQHVIGLCSRIKLSPPPPAIETRHTEEDEADHNVSHDPALIVEHSFLLLSSLLGSFKYEVEKRKELEEAPPEEAFSAGSALELWLWALQDPLQPLLCLEEELKERKNKMGIHAYDIFPLKPLTAASGVLSQLCACVLASVGESWLNRILRTVRFLLWSDEYELQLCGIRVVGFTVGYPTVREHMTGPELVRTASELSMAILSSREGHVNKDRIMAAWALANISSALSAYKETWQRLRKEGPFLSSALVLRYLDSCILGCQDKDKIKPHAVRSIGNLVAFLTPDMGLIPGIDGHLNKAMETLIECSVSGNNMKMRWNACHALGNILSSPDLQLEGVPWRSAVIVSLSRLTEQFKNYKVRIQASIALCQVGTKGGFGPEYTSVWKSYLRSLDNFGNVLDFQEVQHRDDLVHQICIGICHLTQLLQLGDLEALHDPLSLHKDAVHAALVKSNENLTAERASCFVKAYQHVKDIEQQSDALTLSQQSCLSLLAEMLRLP